MSSRLNHSDIFSSLPTQFESLTTDEDRFSCCVDVLYTSPRIDNARWWCRRAETGPWWRGCPCQYQDVHGWSSNHCNGNNACGGALISPTHVLSASHCSSNYDLRWVSVGSHYINGSTDGEQIKIASIMNHPEYESGLFPNDFLILELQKPSSLTPVKLASADDSDFAVGKSATILGWGHTANNGSVSYELRGVSVPLWDDDNCTKVMGADASMVCAGGVANKDACEKDSGGPLVLESETQDVVIGVSSWGPSPCGTEGAPGVYSRVSHARAWIDSVVNGTCFA